MYHKKCFLLTIVFHWIRLRFVSTDLKFDLSVNHHIHPTLIASRKIMFYRTNWMNILCRIYLTLFVTVNNSISTQKVILNHILYGATLINLEMREIGKRNNYFMDSWLFIIPLLRQFTESITWLKSFCFLFD